jgi:ADP-ribosylation factor-like protein 8
MWERYCRDANAIIFVVDAADPDALPVAKEELHALLVERNTLDGIPLLVLANKSDLEGKLGVDEVIAGLELGKVRGREISCYGVSAREETNLEAVLQWLVARSGGK